VNSKMLLLIAAICSIAQSVSLLYGLKKLRARVWSSSA